MDNQLPEGFQWPEELESPEEGVSQTDFMQTAQHDGWSSSGVVPDTFPKSHAAHYGLDPDIEVFPLVGAINDGKQFSMQDPKESGGGWTVQVFPGWVYSFQPKAAHSGPSPRNPIDEEMPEIGGVKLNVKSGDPPEFPRLAVAIGDTVSLRIERTIKGYLQGPVVVMVKPDDADSDHYHPDIIPSDEGDAEEYLFWDVFEVEDDGNGGIKSNPKWQDDVILTPFLWTGEHLGGGEEIIKEFAETEDIYKLRTLVDEWGVDVRTNGDVIEFELRAENCTAEGVPILLTKAESDAEGKPLTALLRRIAQGAASNRKQIEVVQDGCSIRVQGNNNTGFVRFLNCAQYPVAELTYEDGLWTTEDNAIEIQLGECNHTGYGNGTVSGGTGSLAIVTNDSTYNVAWEVGIVTTNGEQSIDLRSITVPTGSSGDMLYHDGTRWVLLEKPPTGTISGGTWVLTHNETRPVWGEFVL